MTKFEEEAIKEAEKSKFIMNSYDGEFTASDIGLNIKLGRVAYNFPWLEFAKNWHSEEEFQELFDKYSNLNDHYEKEVIRSSKLESQIIGLKSQLQQQALPVVPECVGEWIDKNISVAHNAELMIHNILICAIDNKNRYLFPLEVEKFVLKNPITFLNAVITGKYQVEKPQMFYLKNKLTTSYLALDINTGYYEHWGEEIIPKLLNKQGYKTSFTQQEIDSMETGSYEQIEVEK